MLNIVGASKRLSFVLRHNPGSIGVQLDDAGWADVTVLCTALGSAWDREFLDDIVGNNNKKRFKYSANGTQIRARQGHSIPVNLGYAAQTPPEWLYHGTSAAAMQEILKHGIHKMDRHAVHLSADKETAMDVGLRHGPPVMLIVCSDSMKQNGASFYLTDNGVWLTDYVPVGYILFPCSECHQEIDKLYMVNDDLWASVVVLTRENLHKKCLEKRLGRSLIQEDFTHAPINYMEGHVPLSWVGEKTP